MKKYLLLLFVLPVISFVSCDDDDDYSLDKFWVGLATVENPGEDSNFYLRLDNDELLWIASTNDPNYRPKSGQRILADYTILNDQSSSAGYDHDIKLNDAYNILTKSIYTVSKNTQDSIGYDPIGIRDMWIGSDYLNVKFFYRGYNQRHMISLVRDTAKVYNDNKIHLEIRHNAHNDATDYTFSGIASFNLSSLQALPRLQPLDIVVHYTDYQGKDLEQDFSYNYDDRSNTMREFNREFFQEGKEVPID